MRTNLIIDDNVTLREALTDILVFIAATVFTAANGQEGLEILQRERQNISLVLLAGDEWRIDLPEIAKNRYGGGVWSSTGFPGLEVRNRQPFWLCPVTKTSK